MQLAKCSRDILKVVFGLHCLFKKQKPSPGFATILISHPRLKYPLPFSLER